MREKLGPGPLPDLAVLVVLLLLLTLTLIGGEVPFAWPAKLTRRANPALYWLFVVFLAGVATVVALGVAGGL